MANRRGYYYGQQVTSPELQAGFDNLEAADRNQCADLAFVGIASGGIVTQHGPTADLTVDVTAVLGYDQNGERLQFPSTQTQSLATDSNSVSTSVITGGNSKIVSLFLQFKRANSDQRTDLNATTVYFVQDESFQFVIVQGAEAVSPTPPALLSNAILLADVTRTFGQTQIFNANISTSRRQDMFVTIATPQGLRRGLVKDALSDIIGYYNAHVTGAADRHTGATVDLSGMPSWAGGTSPTNPNATLAVEIVKIINDLSAFTGGASGAHRLGSDARSNWIDGTTNPAVTVFAAINKMVTDLADNTTASHSGAHKIGATALTGSPDACPAGTVASQLQFLQTGVDARSRSNSPETITGAWVFTQAPTLNASPPIALASRSVTRTVTQPFQVSPIASNLFNTTAGQAAANDAAQQVLDLPHNATLTAVTLRVHPNNGTPPAGTKIAGNIQKRSLATGVVSLLPIGGTYDPATGAAYGAIHDYVVTVTGGGVVIDRTAFTYQITLNGETGTGASGCEWIGSTWTGTLTGIDDGVS